MGLLYTLSSTAALGFHSYWPQALPSFYLLKKRLMPIWSIFLFFSV